MRCMAESRCRARDERGDPALTDGFFLCFYCLESAERDVRALVLDYRDLEQQLPPSLGVWGDGMPRGSTGRPLPLNEHALNLQHEIWFLTDAWDAVVRDVARLSDKPPRTRAGWAVQQSVSILAPRLDVLAEASGVMWDYPGAVERCEEIPGWQGVLDLGQLHHRARTALGLTARKREHCGPVPCRRCDLKLLFRVPGEDSVECDGCKLWYDAAGYERWVQEVAASVNGIVRPAA